MIFIDCIGVGILIASVLWLVSNKFLLKANAMELDVEWGYCFDVHLKYVLTIILSRFALNFINLIFQRLLSTPGDFAFCPIVLLQYPHKSSLVYCNSVWQHLVAGSYWLLFVHHISGIPFIAHTRENKGVFVSFRSSTGHLFGQFDSQLEHFAKSYVFLHEKSALINKST